MGSACTKQQAKHTKQPLKSSNPWHQNSLIIKQEDKTYVQSSYPINKDGYEDWRSRVSKASGYPNSSFHYLPLDLGFVEDKKNDSVIANYPIYPVNLADEIKRRQPERLYFRERQLYYLLYALTAVKMDSKAVGENVGDIKPENVFLSAEEKVKIGTFHSFPYTKSGFAKLLDKLKPDHTVLVAPEDLKDASLNNLASRHNANSETFSIGATVLSAGLLDDMSSIYDYPNNAFKLDQHKKKTIQWLEHPDYSQIFKSIVLSCVHPDPQKRISMEDLWAFLYKHKKSILAKEEFVVKKPASQIENGVSIIRSAISSIK